MKKTNKTKLLIFLLSLIILIISFSFIIQSVILNKYKNNKNYMDIKIVKVSMLTPIKAGNIEPKSNYNIVNEGLSTKFDFDLFSPNDEINYLISIKNIGNKDGKIIKIISSPDYENDEDKKNKIYPVILKLENIKNKKVAPGEVINIKLSLKYNKFSSQDFNKAINVPFELSILSSNY